jgi:hypothetical protein
MNNELMFNSRYDAWGTPQKFFDKLNNEFSFDIDVCATEDSAKCSRFFNPQQDAFKQNWGGGYAS